VTVPNGTQELNVSVGSNLPVGSSLAFGVDNLGVALQLVPPEVFAVSLPASISNGVPSAGAGNLETTSSEDDYAFTTVTGGGLVLDFSSCSDSVNWALINTDTNKQLSSGRNRNNNLVASVPADDYKIVVTDPGTTATYKASISTA
jgi:hypothetical protein